MMGNFREITVPAKLEEIPSVFDFIREVMNTSGFEIKKIMEMQLAAEEACTNISNYAYGGRDGYIHIVAVTENDLHLILEDCGTPFDPTIQKAPAIESPAEERPIGGLGIFLIKHYVDEAYYEHKDGMNILELVKNKN
jgi:serine/threonine-protein kinase RsbW